MSSRLEKLKNHFSTRINEFSETLHDCIIRETPTGEKDRLDSFATYYRRYLGPLVNKVEFTDTEAGKIITANTEGEGKPVLILMHMDTVWPIKAPGKPKLKREGNLLYGPGAFDMKASLALIPFVLSAMRELNLSTKRPLIIMLTPDEESGSNASRDQIIKTARECEFALVMEFPLPGGHMKVKRKAVADFQIEIKGKESHSGVNPQDGVNAIHELAHQISRIVALEDSETETTINVNTMSGGTTRNVVAGRAVATIDIRSYSEDKIMAIERTLHSLPVHLAGAEIILTGGLNRPPMLLNKEGEQLVQLALKIWDSLGRKIEGKATGGGSDGSFTSAAGIPTLDGIGLEGGGAHTPDEFVDLTSFAERATFLTEFLLRA